MNILNWLQLSYLPTGILGASVLGVEIPYYEFPARPKTSKPLVDTLYIGAFHGDEPLSAVLMGHWITWLYSHSWFPTEPSRVIGVIPVLNPDGLKANTRQNARQVDLNRNFPTKNWAKGKVGDWYYGGKSAASEPETKHLIQYIEARKPLKVVSVHTPYRVLNYDGQGSEALARLMSQYNHYPAVPDIGYPTPGSFGNYMGIERQVPTITLELPEDEPFDILLHDNIAALRAALSTSRNCLYQN